jgi:hypothetical protein
MLNTTVFKKFSLVNNKFLELVNEEINALEYVKIDTIKIVAKESETEDQIIFRVRTDMWDYLVEVKEKSGMELIDLL